MNSNKSVLLAMFSIPIFMLITSFDLSIQTDRINALIFLGYTYPIFFLLYYLVKIKNFKPMLVLSIGILLWTSFTSFLFKDTFITIGLFIISILVLVTITVITKEPN